MDPSGLANLRAIIQIASKIQELGNNWYKASADWTEFPRKLAYLKRQHEFWVAKLTEYGMLADSSLMETLREAETSLREEQLKQLSRRRSRYGSTFWSKASMTIFPAQIGQSIQRVIDAFDAIPGQLKMEQEATVTLDNRVMWRPLSLAIREDKCYVPMKTESTVYSALEDALGPSIVLLYGLPGTGKSALARHTALHYHNRATSGLFARVVLLECGREADFSTKQLDLLQRLSPSLAASLERERGESSSAVTIRSGLSSFLKVQKVLIILDDVWEGEFLQRMVALFGTGVRCLVTSQRGDLCDGFNSSATRILMEDAEPAAAMEILQSHVGYRKKQIPPDIKEVALNIVEKAEGHPLALASIATAIDYNRLQDLEEWDFVYDNFLHVLRSAESPASVLGDKYSKSFWSTMQLCIQSLEPNAQKLLVLVHMCRGPSVPEEVLQVLCVRGLSEAGFQTFKKARKELENRGLIKITDSDNARSWSMHSVLKLFMEEEIKDWKESMFNVLVPIPSNAESTCKLSGELYGNEDVMIQTAVCALYFDKHFSDKAASALDIPSDRLNGPRRNAIEPITRLLGRPVGQRWTSASEAAAKQVFWTYISTCALHNDGLVYLLGLPMSIIPVLKVLNDIATIEETCLLDANSQGFMNVLVNLLEDENRGDAIIAMAAAKVIVQLSRNKLHIEILISRGILDAIFRILSRKYHPGLKNSLVQIWVSIIDKCPGSQEMIVKNPETLDLVVKSLFKDSNVFVQSVATATLRHLTGSGLRSTKRTIIRSSRVPGQLIRLMSNHAVPAVQEQATEALANLAASYLEERRQTISQFPGALEQLINLFSKRTISSDTQGVAVRALTLLVPPQRVGAWSTEYFDYSAYTQRRRTDVLRGLYEESLDEVEKMMAWDASSLRRRGEKRARLADFEGALADFNSAIEIERSSFVFQERGVLKRIIGDLPGALADLNEGLKLGPDDYERLKHRGYVRFLMKDENGARADAERALAIKPGRIDRREYGLNNCLGTFPVEFLNYKLR